MSDTLTSKPIVEWLRDHESLSISGLRYKEAADEIDSLKRQVQIAWAAGIFIEGEGAICGARKYKSIRRANGERVKSGFRWWLVIHSTDHDVLRRFSAVVVGQADSMVLTQTRDQQTISLSCVGLRPRSKKPKPY